MPKESDSEPLPTSCPLPTPPPPPPVGVRWARLQLHSKQRNPEVHLIRFCLEKLGIPILGQIPAPGKLEGGDFIPAGRELCPAAALPPPSLPHDCGRSSAGKVLGGGGGIRQGWVGESVLASGGRIWDLGTTEGQ